MDCPTTYTPWLRRDQWSLFCSVYADSHELPATFDDWLRQAQGCYVAFTRTGLDVCRVDVDLHQLIPWCRREGRRLDAAAMMQFAIERGSAATSAATMID